MPNEYFDKKIHNCALKKLSIDSNSLVAKGLKPEHVARLYNGIFVFGMGFNELVAEITRGEPLLVKPIWKIFSLVLEYCSRGDLETSMGVLEKEYSTKIIELAAELERKQGVIERNEELNERKNNEIYS